mmetsp:Transcript_41722/g.67009  ORF Transcript_41722/g.67009 Transcript_41722/m.67009 type:complete len:464 (+) Transcript_41722:398-1789(+)
MGTVSSPPRVMYSAFFGYLSLLVLLGPLDHVEAQCQTSSCSGSGSSMTIDGKYYSCCSANSRMCTSDWCPASCSRNTDALDFQTSSGDAYWENTGFSKYWKCSQSWCDSTSLLYEAHINTGKIARFRPSDSYTTFNTNDLLYSAQKYYVRATFTDYEGATPSNAVGIRLVKGEANCATDIYDTTALKALPVTKMYDNLCSGQGYRRSADVVYGKYEATHGPFYKGDTFCYVFLCSASSGGWQSGCPKILLNFGIYMELRSGGQSCANNEECDSGRCESSVCAHSSPPPSPPPPPSLPLSPPPSPPPLPTPTPTPPAATPTSAPTPTPTPTPSPITPSSTSSPSSYSLLESCKCTCCKGFRCSASMLASYVSLDSSSCTTAGCIAAFPAVCPAIGQNGQVSSRYVATSSSTSSSSTTTSSSTSLSTNPPSSTPTTPQEQDVPKSAAARPVAAVIVFISLAVTML